uniref:RING-type E3 ubiquitin transferase n=1 Tax=Pogona vitticeps TaxID=103695 RepID=A0ABM5GR89_9SAUR
MYEAKERQKFINDAQYLREMQHKMDSEYQACLRKQEPTREQTEKKRDHHTRPELRQTSISSISAVRTCERPWISRLPINRKTSSDEVSGCELKSSIKSLGNKPEAKFPAIDKTSVKQKQKQSTCSRKSERNGSGPRKDTAVFQKPILARRRMNQRSFPEHSDLENIRKVEGRGRKTPVLQGITKIAREFDSQDAMEQKINHAPKAKKKSQEKRNLNQSSKLSIDSKRLDKNLKKGSVLTTVHQPPTNSMDSTVQVANIPSISTESNNSNLPPIKNTSLRPQEDDFCAMLCSHVEDSPGENEDTKDFVPLEEELLSVDFSKPPPLDQNSRVGGTSSIQSAQYNCEIGVGGDGRRSELPHRLLRPYNVTGDPANEQSTAGQRKTRDQRKPYIFEENFLEESHKSEDSSHQSLFRANFTAHLHMTGPLPDQVPIFLTVSDLRNQSTFVSSTTSCNSPSAKEINKPETDPEKLKKLQESLLAEDSEEEGDQCRICQIAGGSITNPLLEPCGCGGSLRFVHQECLKTWLKAKIKSGAELGAVKTCELCKQSLTVDLDDFNVNDYYRNHQQSRAQDELMNSGLYLVLLLHLYEQRFAELMRLNYHQASRDRLSRQPRTEENQNSTNSGNTG